MRGEWIEIAPHRSQMAVLPSLPMRGEWIEIGVGFRGQQRHSMSLPMRGEWIEICVINGAFG